MPPCSTVRAQQTARKLPQCKAVPRACAQTRTVAQTVATLPVAGHGVAQTVAAGELRLHPHPIQVARACMPVCHSAVHGHTQWHEV